MSTLFIIGNGFDLFHGLLTSYSNFKDFYKESSPGHYWRAENQLPAESNWCDLESALGNVDLVEIQDNAFDCSVSPASDDWSDADNHTVQFEAEETITALSKTLHQQFCEWLKTIEIDAYADLYLDPQAKYLTFNYTHTLETLYDIPSEKILHIHGEVGGEIILGHDFDPADADKFDEVGDEDSDFIVTQTNSILNRYFGSTFKPVSNIIESNLPFFESCADIDKVMVLGHSLETVDMPYFEELLKNVPDDAIWFVTYYDQNEKRRHELKLKKMGVDYQMVKMDFFSDPKFIGA